MRPELEGLNSLGGGDGRLIHRVARVRWYGPNSNGKLPLLSLSLVLSVKGYQGEEVKG